MFRLIASFCVAIALFFSPLAMLGDGGMAMSHVPSIEGTMDDHCPGSNEAGEGESSQATTDCAGLCSAIAAGAPTSEHEPLVPAPNVALLPPFPGGILPESETPPPRFS